MAGNKGERNGNSVFSKEQILSIRRMAKEVNGYGQRVYSAGDIARQYQAFGLAVSAETIARIIRRNTWGWIPDEDEEDALVKTKMVAPLSSEMKMKIEASQARVLQLVEEGKKRDMEEGLDRLLKGGQERELP